MSVDDSSGAPAKRRWVKPVLVVSLALNLLFAGLIAGAVWKRGFGGWSGPRHKVFEAAIEQMITELPAEKRKMAEDVLARLRSDVLPRARGHRQARKRVVDVLKADPFSEEDFRNALAEVRNIRADVDKGRHGLAVELVRELNVQERRRLLEIYRSKKRQYRGRWWKLRRDGRP